MAKTTTKAFLDLIESDVDRHFPKGSQDRMKAFALFADVTKTLEDNRIIKAAE